MVHVVDAWGHTVEYYLRLQYGTAVLSRVSVLLGNSYLRTTFLRRHELLPVRACIYLSSIMSSSWTVIGKNGAAAAKVRLQRGARVKAEPDALITMSQHVEIGADMDAGLVSGFMRSALGGESLFSQTLTALADGQEVVLGAPEVGDIEIIRVSRDSPLLLTKGAFLAADTSVQLTTATQTSAGGALFSGAGLFVLRACGQGSLAVGAHGSILKFELHAGEERAVDNGHLRAERAHADEMRLASSGGGRGRGLFTSMYARRPPAKAYSATQGPGSLWLQTHKPPIESDGKGANDSSGRSASSGRNSRGEACRAARRLVLVLHSHPLHRGGAGRRLRAGPRVWRSMGDAA